MEIIAHKKDCTCQLLYWSKFSVGPIVQCWTCDPPQGVEDLKRGPGIGTSILTKESITQDIEKSNAAAVIAHWAPYLPSCKLTTIRDAICPLAAKIKPFVPPEPPKDVPVIAADDPRYVPRELIEKYARDYRAKMEAEKAERMASEAVQVRTPAEQMPARGDWSLNFVPGDLEEDPA